MTHTPPSLRQNAAASPRVDHARPKSKGGWVVQIFGEILITVGLVLLLFVAWQPLDAHPICLSFMLHKGYMIATDRFFARYQASSGVWEHVSARARA